MQDKYWIALVSVSCPPGFSRTLALPVLYPIYSTLATHERPIQHNVESLLTYSERVQRQAVHVVLPEEAIDQKGFVYTGPAMGLPGGGFWNLVGRTVVSIGTGAVAGALVGAALGVGIVGGVIGGIVGGINGAFSCVRESFERNAERKKLESLGSRIKETNKTGVQCASDILEDMKKKPASYKDIETIIAKLNSARSEVQSSLSSLNNMRQHWKVNSQQFPFKITVTSFYKFFPVIDMGAPSDATGYIAMWEEDINYLNECVETAEESLKKIDSTIQQAKEQARSQALEVFKEERAGWEASIQVASSRLDRAFSSIASDEHGTANNLAYTTIQALRQSIEKLKEWKKEAALFSVDRDSINSMIEYQEVRLKKTEVIERMVHYANQDEENASAISRIAQDSTPQGMIRHCVRAIIDGTHLIVEYLLFVKGLPPNSVYMRGNTLLHHAVMANQPAMVRYLMQQSANLFATNQEGKTPLAIARENNNQEIIALLSGRQ